MNSLYIHFNKPQHFLTIDEFIKTSTSIQKVSKAFIQTVSNEQNKFEIVVLPPEEGSFLTKFAYSCAALGGLASFLDTDISQKFIKGLTGNEPSYYAENAGKLIRDSVINIMEKENDELDKIIPSSINIDAALKSKSDFYKMCVDNHDIKAIGFDDKDDFPIKRNTFYKHITEDIVRPLPPELVLQKLIIHKPVNTKNDAKWTFIDKSNRGSLVAGIEDSQFKRDFLNGRHPLKRTNKDDEILAMVQYDRVLINGEEKYKDRNIVDIYEFNNEKLKKAPENISLNIPRYKKDENPTLFDID